MLNFLRKLRRKEGNTGRYFQYALGEIILVVIGILIAVNINNWNENRKIKIKEDQLLSKLKTENELNTAELVNDSSYHTSVDMIATRLHRALSAGRSAKNDSIIETELIALNRSVLYTFSSKYLERYIENSEFDSDELVDELVELREYQKNLSKVSQLSFDFKFDRILPYLEDYVDPYTGEISNIQALRTNAFINRVVILENLLIAEVEIYEACLQMHLHLDSLLTVRLGK